MNKKKSMLDIAQLAGVSIATVSRVLNNNGRYSAETEKKVLSVVKKYDYRINQSAKGLRTKKTQSIGVVVPDITNEFFAKIVRSVESNLISKGYTVFVCDSDENEQMEDLHISSLDSKDVDGMIYISTKSDVGKIYEKYSIPVVYIDRRPENAGLLITSDNVNGGFLATQELIKAGCKNILYVKDEKNHSTVIQRLDGYKKAHEQYGLKFDENNIISIKISYKEAFDTVVHLIESGKTFDGIFCNNDILALAALHAIHSKGLRVPQDVKIVGYDSIQLSEICYPPITSVWQNTDEFGRIAVEELLNLINGKKECGNSDNKDIVIPVSLVKRRSTESE